MPRKNGLCFSFVLCLKILALLDRAWLKEKEGSNVNPPTPMPIPTSILTAMPTPPTELSALLLPQQLSFGRCRGKDQERRCLF